MTKYIPPTVTVDLTLFRIQNGKLQILLLKRQNDPFMGHWALPGGYAPRGETTLQALRRVMRYKTGVDINDLPYISQLYVFDAVDRDPRGHAVSIDYIASSYDTDTPKSADEVAWFDIDNLPDLAYDHEAITTFGRDRLVSEITHTNFIKTFLPPLFSLSDLQRAYEAIMGQKLDKRNFQKRFFRFDQIVVTDKLKHNANSRPAKLYKFKNKDIEPLDGDMHVNPFGPQFLNAPKI